jgi:hypothetical protein
VVTDAVDPKWSQQYDVIIANRPAGGAFEEGALGALGIMKNEALTAIATLGRGRAREAPPVRRAGHGLRAGADATGGTARERKLCAAEHGRCKELATELKIAWFTTHLPTVVAGEGLGS